VTGELAGLVLAAGRGERLRPLTDRTPKPLLPIGGTTLLDAMLDRLAAVVPVAAPTMAVNAHWLASQLVAHLGDRVHVSVEEPEALGTAGAVAAISAWRAGRDLLVANGDAYLAGDLDLAGFVAGWDGVRPRLLVVADTDRPDFEGRWRFAGISLLPAALAEPLAATPSGLYEAVWSRTELDLVQTAATFVDCGTVADYQRARDLAAGGNAGAL
jgi:N-acetyl-alpha-D-muramate 1-phosphate uridylyltransferase